jgi:hypothetical protein
VPLQPPFQLDCPPEDNLGAEATPTPDPPPYPLLTRAIALSMIPYEEATPTPDPPDSILTRSIALSMIPYD